jgi:hypothetical protein
VGGTIDDALFRNEQIQKKLKGYDSMSLEESNAQLGLPERTE